MQPLLGLALLVLLLASPAPALCRHRAPAAATETLDVAGSLSRARAAVSTDALPLHQSLAATDSNVLIGEEHSSGKSGLTLQLHSRDFLPEEQGRHQSYRSPVLTRLRRDSARAAALSARASPAADGISRADLKPANTMPIFEIFKTCTCTCPSAELATSLVIDQFEISASPSIPRMINGVAGLFPGL